MLLIFVSLDIQFSALVASFGRHVKFYVKKNESTTVRASSPGSFPLPRLGTRLLLCLDLPDAFAIFVGSSREQFACKALPSRVTVRNKDELYIVIITFSVKEELK